MVLAANTLVGIEMSVVRLKERQRDHTVYQSLLDQGMPEVVARVVAGRPVPKHEKGAMGVVLPKLADLDDPVLLRDMEKAVARIIQAIQSGEIIALETDHDCDGQTSHAVLYTALTQILRVPESQVQSYIGHRMQEGYGLSDALASRILATEPRPNLVITADNGSADEPRIAKLKEAGIDVIVTDHHAIPQDGVPESAHAVLNPTREDCQYPDVYIAGCMVAWLLMAKIRSAMIAEGLLPEDVPSMASVLDFVAVGTVADCVSLARSVNNRAIVRYGLQMINRSQRPCWQAIRPLLRGESVGAQDLGFTIAPLLNSDGRLSDAFGSVNFLLSSDLKEASPWAQQLWQQNEERKAIQKQLVADAAQVAAKQAMAGRWSLVVNLLDGHAGVHGIAASRIKDQFGRPTILFSPKVTDDALISGSARSIDALHIRDALQYVADHHPDILQSFGGHRGAAGLTIKREDFDRFSAAFEEAVRQQLTSDNIGPELLTDGCLTPECINSTTFKQLSELEPFGREFDPPVFVSQLQLQSVRWVGADQTHAQLVFSANNQQTYKGIWFQAVDYEIAAQLSAGMPLQVSYSLTENVFRNTRSLQLMIKDVRVA